MPVCAWEQALQVQPGALCAQRALRVLLGGSSRVGMWQRSWWVWGALISRDVLWDAQDQTFSPNSWVLKRKHKLLWLMMKQKLHFAFGPSKPNSSTFHRVFALIQIPREFQLLPLQDQSSDGIPLAHIQCFVVVFLLPYRPQRALGSLGL